MDELDGYAALAVAIISSATDVYHSGKYPPNVNTSGFPSPRMEVLTFFHGDLFTDLMDMLEIDSNMYLHAQGIPTASNSCPCESCRLNYTLEAMLLKNNEDTVYSIKGKAKLAYQFAEDSQHIVYWDRDSIQFVLPYESGPVMKANQYIKGKLL